MPHPSNPILLCLNSLEDGQPLEEVMQLRDQSLTSPAAWLVAGWEALAEMEPTHKATPWLVELMRYAWDAAGPAGRDRLERWKLDQTQGSQKLLIISLSSAGSL